LTERERQLAELFDQLFPVLMQNLLQHVTRETQKVGLTVAQFYFLRQLRRDGPWTAAQVGDALGITSGPVSGLTKRMITQGLVDRRTDEDDRRVAWFSVTERGQALLAEAERHLLGLWGNIVHEFGAERGGELLDLLAAVSGVLRQLQPGSREP
jgi:DNA-binding MarR family transcriptional regulator